MSVVGDIVWNINTQLNTISRDQDLFIVSEDEQVSLQEQGVLVAAALEKQQVADRLGKVRSLSMESSSQPLLSRQQIERILYQSGLIVKEGDRPQPTEVDDSQAQSQSQFELEIEWLLVAKAAMQIYGSVLQTLINQHISLDQHIRYWEDVSSSRRYGLVYFVQRWPIQLWHFSRDVYLESRLRIQALYQPETLPSSHSTDPEDSSDDEVGLSLKPEPAFGAEATTFTTLSLSQRWRRLYQIVQTTIHDRSLLNIQDKILSPIALCQAEARDKLQSLKRLKENLACGIGALIDETFFFKGGEWKDNLERSVDLMDTVLAQTGQLDGQVNDFEERIFQNAERDLDVRNRAQPPSPALRPRRLAVALLRILETQLPNQVSETKSIIGMHGQPSRLARYWLPATVALFSSTSLLRFFVNRKAQIVQWITEIGATARDFWTNWVVDPVRKVIGTIRHDENSEIALMSRDSLRADLESLERMVVDFVVDKPHFVGAEAAQSALALSESQISEIRSNVSRGDVTPVLKAYEKDLKSPLMGTIRGDLVRSLLIQVQKSKVDMEVALSGIDSLLKSQELVFGFVGLTPGILVSAFVIQYLHGILLGRSGSKKRERAGKATRAIRTIGRMLTKVEVLGEVKALSYEQVGTLYCQAHILRTVVPRNGMMPRDTERDFLADLNELVSLRASPYQKRILDDIAFTYQKWIM